MAVRESVRAVPFWQPLGCDSGAETIECKLEYGDRRAGKGVSALHVSGGECSKESSAPSNEDGAEWILCCVRLQRVRPFILLCLA